MQFILLQRSRAARCILGNQLQGMQLECNPRAARVPPFCHHRYRGKSLRLSTMKILLWYYHVKKESFLIFKIFLCDPLSCMICVMRVFYWFFCIIFSFSFFNFKYYDELWNINIVSGFNSSIGACNCWGEKWSLVFLRESLL